MIRMIWLLAFAALFVAGCATAPQPGPPPAPTEEEETAEAPDGDEGPAGTEGEAASTAPAADCPPTCDFARNAVDEPSGVLSDRTIYFEFDSSEVREEFMDVIERHAAYLTQYPDVEVRLEGHTDERGSREYNIGLGARRAASVRGLLHVYGVSEDQIESVSYGEEMPAERGEGEEAWSQNRRVELVYAGSGGSN